MPIITPFGNNTESQHVSCEELDIHHKDENASITIKNGSNSNNITWVLPNDLGARGQALAIGSGTNDVTRPAGEQEGGGYGNQNNLVWTTMPGIHVMAACDFATTTALNITNYTVKNSTGSDPKYGEGATITITDTAIDGVLISSMVQNEGNQNARILVKNQTGDQICYNGIYVKTNNTTLTRASDFDEHSEIQKGNFCYVLGGNNNQYHGYILTSDSFSSNDQFVTSTGGTNGSDIVFNDISVHLETNEPILLEPNLNKLYLKLVDQDGTTEIENLSTQTTHNSLWSSRTTKEYVDSVSEGLHILEPCLTGSFGNYLNTYTHPSTAGQDQTQPPVHIDYNSTLEVDFTSQSNSLNGLNASDGTTIVTGLQSYDTNTNTYKIYTESSPTNLQDGSYTITGHQGDFGKGALFQFTISNSGNSIGNIKCIRAGQGYKNNGADDIIINNTSFDQNGALFTSFSGSITITIDQITLVPQIDGIEIVDGSNENIPRNIIKYHTDENIASRIFIKNQTNLNENGIYYISGNSSNTFTFTRTSDFNSIFIKDNPYYKFGDIRPGDYAYILQGTHGSNKNHAFVLSNEHIGLTEDGSITSNLEANKTYKITTLGTTTWTTHGVQGTPAVGSIFIASAGAIITGGGEVKELVWLDTDTQNHTDQHAIVISAFTGAEAIHVDNSTIEVSGSDRHLQLKNVTSDTNGNYTFTGNLTASGNTLSFGNNATIVNTNENTLTITETTTNFSENVTVGNDLTINGNTLTIGSGGATLVSTDGSTLTITETDTNFNGNVKVTNTLTIGNSGATFSSDGTTLSINEATTSFSGNVTVTGNTLTIGSGGATIVSNGTDTLTITEDNTNFNGNVNVSNDLIISGTTDTNSTSAESGALQVRGGVGVSGDIFIGGNALYFDNNASIVNTNGSTLTIDETTTNFTGDVTIDNNLTITGNTLTFGSGSGATIQNANNTLTIDETTTNFTGDVTIDNDLTITGDTLTFGSGATIENANNTLTITENTTSFIGDLTSNGTITGAKLTDNHVELENGAISNISSLSGDAIIDDIVETNGANKVYASNTIKEYIDATAEGLHVLEPCLVGTSIRYAHSDVSKTLNTAGSSGNTTLYIANTTGILIGMKISGPNIQNNTFVTAVSDTNSIDISKPITGTIETTANITFSHYSHNYTGYEAHSNLIVDFNSGQTAVNGASNGVASGGSSLKTGIPMSHDPGTPNPTNITLSEGTYTLSAKESGTSGKGCLIRFTINGSNTITSSSVFRSGQGYEGGTSLRIDNTSIDELGDTNTFFSAANQYIDFNSVNSNDLVLQIDGLEIQKSTSTNYSTPNIFRTPEYVIQTSQYINNSTTIDNTQHIYNNLTVDDSGLQVIGDGIPEGVTATYDHVRDNNTDNFFTFSQAITVESGTTIYFKRDLSEPDPSRIYIKNQTNLNENGIYFINNVTDEDVVTFTRTNDYNSIFDKVFNPDGDVRAGDYAFITSGIHNNNKDHAFLLSNEHINVNIFNLLSVTVESRTTDGSSNTILTLTASNPLIEENMFVDSTNINTGAIIQSVTLNSDNKTVITILSSDETSIGVQNNEVLTIHNSDKFFNILGSAVISTEHKKFGSSSLKLVKTNSQYITCGNEDFNLNNKNITIEFYVKFNTITGTQTLFDFRSASDSDTTFYMYYDGSNSNILVYIGNTSIFTSGISCNFNTTQFYHIMFTNNYDSSGRCKVFVDNVLKGTSSGTHNPGSITTPKLTIGAKRDGTDTLDGFIDEFRFSHIVRNNVYHNRPLKPDEHTKVLLHFEGEDDSTIITDSSNWAWKGLTTTEHNNKDAIFITPFTGVETLHTDNVTIGLHGSERYLQAFGLNTEGMSGTGLPLSSHQIDFKIDGTTRANLTDTNFSIAPLNSTDSSSTTTGALTVAGGVGITDNMYVGGDINVTGNVTADRLNINNIRIDGNIISSTDTNGIISLTPNGTGSVVISTGLDITGAAGIILENDETITNSTSGTVLINGEVAAGTGSDAGVFKSNGNQDLTLKTSNNDTGTITIENGSNGDISLTPHDGDGSARIVIGDGNNGHQAILSSNNEQDLVLKTGSTAGTGTITITDGINGNISLTPHDGDGSARIVIGDGNSSHQAILSSNNQQDLVLKTGNSATGDITIADGADGHITLNPDGSGTVDISKANITGGTINGTSIGATSGQESTGAFTTIVSTQSITAGTSFIIGSADINETDLEKIDDISNGTAAANKALVLGPSKDIGTIRNLTIDGTFSDGHYTFDTSGNVSGLGTVGCGAITSTGDLDVTGTITGDTSLTLDGITITSAEIGVLDNVAAGTAAASKALVLDGNRDIVNIGNLTATESITAGSSFIIGSADINETDLEKIDGITDGTAAANKALVLDGNRDIVNIGNLTTTGSITAGSSFIIGSVDINETDLEKIDGITDGTAAANKALVLDGNRDIVNIGNLTTTGTITGNLTGDVTGDVTGDLTGDVTSSGTSTFSTITASTSLDVSGSGGIILQNDETITNSTNGTVLIDGEVAAGTSDTNVSAVFKSNGNQDLTLKTGNTTNTGYITLANGANGNITFETDGTGNVIFNPNDGTSTAGTGIEIGGKTIKTHSTYFVNINAGVLEIGDGNGSGTIQSSGSQHLKIRTGNTTNTGYITMVQGQHQPIKIEAEGDGSIIIGRTTFQNGSYSEDRLEDAGADPVGSDSLSGTTNDRYTVIVYDQGTRAVKQALFEDVCFLEGTKITLADRTYKNIEDLTLADDVLTYKINELDDTRKKEEIIKWNKEKITGRFSESGIRNIWINPTDSYLVINDILKVTPGHIMFFKREDKYYFSHAMNLRINDELMNSKGEYDKITDILHIKANINVYNFEVDNDSTYFAEDYLVHHMCELCSGYSKIL